MNFKPKWYWFPLYLWALVNTLIGVAFMLWGKPQASTWRQGVWVVKVDRIVGGEWVSGQTWGWLVLVKQYRPSLKVHEFVHVWHSLLLGVFFLLSYGVHYLWNRARGLKHDLAYRAIWTERIAYRVQSEFAEGKRPDAWGADGQ